MVMGLLLVPFYTKREEEPQSLPLYAVRAPPQRQSVTDTIRPGYLSCAHSQSPSLLWPILWLHLSSLVPSQGTGKLMEAFMLYRLIVRSVHASILSPFQPKVGATAYPRPRAVDSAQAARL
jgi:hypothetical protein